MGKVTLSPFTFQPLNSFYCSHRAIKRRYAQRSGRPAAKLQFGEMPSIERIFISRGIPLRTQPFQKGPTLVRFTLSSTMHMAVIPKACLIKDAIKTPGRVGGKIKLTVLQLALTE